LTGNFTAEQSCHGIEFEEEAKKLTGTMPLCNGKLIFKDFDRLVVGR
jgi:hypothetical protein